MQRSDTRAIRNRFSDLVDNTVDKADLLERLATQLTTDFLFDFLDDVEHERV